MNVRRAFPLLLLGPAVVLIWGVTGSSQSPIPVVSYPDPDIGVNTLEARKKAQLETVNQFGVFHDFHFEDKLKESGITFVNRVVDDAARTSCASPETENENAAPEVSL